MTDAFVEFDQQAPIAFVEIDRYCDKCGYNLRTQPVRCDERTEMLMCRCPECGKFHAARDSVTAGSVWLRRLGTLGLFIWILVILAAVLGLGGAQIGVTYGVLDELTRYRKVTVPAASSGDSSAASNAGAATEAAKNAAIAVLENSLNQASANTSAATQPAATPPANSGASTDIATITQQLMAAVNADAAGAKQPAVPSAVPAAAIAEFKTALAAMVSAAQQSRTRPAVTTTVWKREVREKVEHFKMFAVAFCATSCALGFFLSMFATVCLHHWRRWGYLCVAIFVSTAAALIAWFAWRVDVPYLSNWSIRYIALLAAAHLIGGVLGVFLGRPFARLIANLTLPPRLRQVLAFLWLVDGKAPPTAIAAQSAIAAAPPPGRPARSWKGFPAREAHQEKD